MFALDFESVRVVVRDGRTVDIELLDVISLVGLRIAVTTSLVDAQSHLRPESSPHMQGTVSDL